MRMIGNHPYRLGSGPQSVMVLDERYAADYENRTKDGILEERKKQIRREILLAHLALVQKRRAARKEEKKRIRSAPPIETLDAQSPPTESQDSDKSACEQSKETHTENGHATKRLDEENDLNDAQESEQHEYQEPPQAQERDASETAK